jgi:hypothetical protein
MESDSLGNIHYEVAPPEVSRNQVVHYRIARSQVIYSVIIQDSETSIIIPVIGLFIIKQLIQCPSAGWQFHRL